MRTMDEPLNCAGCAAPLESGARFCSTCGAEQPVQVASAEKVETRAKPRRRGVFVALAATVVVLCGAAGGTASYLLFIKEDRKPSPNSEGTPVSEPGGPAPGSGSGGQSPVEDDWPDSRAGFTVALAAMGGPTGAGRMAARGRRAGLEPGVLRSRDYGSLTSDYWFVFHGIFDTIEQAKRDTVRARRAGFRDAYATYISREEPVSTDDSSPDRAGELRSQRRTGYTASVPGDWPLVADEVDFGSRLRSKWRHPSTKGVFVLIDRTAGVDENVLVSARSIRTEIRGSRGYDELAFRRITIGDRSAVEWNYRLGEAKTIDFVINGCGAGFAILGVAPAGEFSTHAADFREVAESLELTC